MADTSGCSQQLEDLQLSVERDHVAARAREGDGATTSASASGSGEVAQELVGCRVGEQIERSRVHWSLLSDQGCSEDGEVAEVSNVAEFLALQSHPEWGGFFETFGYDLVGGRYPRMGELVVGEKFAEGGQAELYEAKVTWWNPEYNEKDERDGTEYVLKVFKEGTFLKDIQSKMPQGLLQHYVETVANSTSPTPQRQPRFSSRVFRGILLKDGRFAFLMRKEHCDLRRKIECNMKSRIGKDCGPFSKEEGELIMYQIALGLEWLHSHDIIHRDLKASNVLMDMNNGYLFGYVCYIADYECSVGVVGTGFFRAPEILQACKDGKMRQRPEVFSKASDTYGYGMVCYEVLTWELPFGGHCINDYDVVLDGMQPMLPKHVASWVSELVSRCWQFDPRGRPKIGEIANLLSSKSKSVKKFETLFKDKFGFESRPNFRNSKFRQMLKLWKV